MHWYSRVVVDKASDNRPLYLLSSLLACVAGQSSGIRFRHWFTALPRYFRDGLDAARRLSNTTDCGLPSADGKGSSGGGQLLFRIERLVDLKGALDI